MKKPCNSNVKSNEGLTPIHVAALWGRFENLKILISSGANIKETDDEGNNALDFAQDAACIKLLLELESNLDSHTSGLTTADNNDSKFSESFYTAIDESVLDRTVVTFPKLHPWHVDQSSCEFDDTIVDGFENLSISSYRYVYHSENK